MLLLQLFTPEADQAWISMRSFVLDSDASGTSRGVLVVGADCAEGARLCSPRRYRYRSLATLHRPHHPQLRRIRSNLQPKMTGKCKALCHTSVCLTASPLASERPRPVLPGHNGAGDLRVADELLRHRGHFQVRRCH